MNKYIIMKNIYHFISKFTNSNHFILNFRKCEKSLYDIIWWIYDVLLFVCLEKKSYHYFMISLEKCEVFFWTNYKIPFNNHLHKAKSVVPAARLSGQLSNSTSIPPCITRTPLMWFLQHTDEGDLWHFGYSFSNCE